MQYPDANTVYIPNFTNIPLHAPEPARTDARYIVRNMMGHVVLETDDKYAAVRAVSSRGNRSRRGTGLPWPKVARFRHDEGQP